MTNTEFKNEIKGGVRLFAITKASEKSSFYAACDELACQGATKKDKVNGGWVAVVMTEPKAEGEVQVAIEPLGEPRRWLGEAPVTNKGVSQKKFIQGGSLCEFIPPAWYSYCAKYHVIVQPAKSATPRGCLYSLLTPVAYVDTATAMLACNESGELLGWLPTVVRGLWSVQAGEDPRALMEGVVELAWSHLQKHSPDSTREEFDEAVEQVKAEVGRTKV